MLGDIRGRAGGPRFGERAQGGIQLLGICDDCHLLQEADHRIANHLSIVAAYVRLKALEFASAGAAADQAAVALVLANVESQIEGVGRLHRASSLSGGAGGVDVGRHLHQLCTQMAAAAPGRLILVEDLAADCRAPAGLILPLGQIVTEILTNAIKHGGREGQPCRVHIRAGEDANGAIALDIVDDGPGLPVGVNGAEGGGFGFRLIRGLARRLGAAITLESNACGVRFRIVLPLRGEGAVGLQ